MTTLQNAVNLHVFDAQLRLSVPDAQKVVARSLIGFGQT